MALFRSRSLNSRATDQDQSWGSNIKQLSGTAGADTNFTLTFSTTTANFYLTMVPFTNVSGTATNDTRTNNGWAVNEAESSPDGMGSISTRKRIVPAGEWGFACAIGYSAPALLASYTVMAEFSVYRVATGGGTRTLLFSVNSNIITVSLVAGSGGLTAFSTQPEYIIEPGETLHLAIRIQSGATSALLGSKTSTVITVQTSVAGNLGMNLPIPGLRNLNYETGSAVSRGAGSRVATAIKGAFNGVTRAEGGIMRHADYFRALSSQAKGVGESLPVGVGVSYSAVGKAAETRMLLVAKGAFAAIGNAVGLRTAGVIKGGMSAQGMSLGTIDRALSLFRSYSAVSSGSGGMLRVVTYVRGYLATAEIEGGRALTVTKSPIQALAVSIGSRTLLLTKTGWYAEAKVTADIAKAVIFVRDFDAAAKGSGSVERVVTFVRAFDAAAFAVIRPRICLDWDDLPASGEIVIVDDGKQKTYFDWE